MRQRPRLAEDEAHALALTVGDDGFDMRMPPHGEKRRVPSMVSALGQVVRWGCEQLRASEDAGASPLLDAMFSLEEPRTGTEGTLAWTVDIANPASGEEFVMGLKEMHMPDGKGPQAVVSDAYIEFGREDAKALQLKDGDLVKVAGNGVELQLKAKVGNRLPKGVLFAPYHFAAAGINRIYKGEAAVAVTVRK